MAEMGLCLLLVGACAPTHQDVVTFLDADEHVASGSSYRLAPSDTISIHSPQAPEIDTTTRIRPDGTVRLRLLGEVRVAGLTDREAAAKLQEELRIYYRDPVIQVSAAEAKGSVFYLYGEVGTGRESDGGQRRITGRDTILNVLTSSLPTQNAWLSQIKVLRPGRTPDQNQEMIIDFHKIIVEGDMRQNILLQQGDIVYVPPTVFAWIGYRIREVLQPVAPVLEAYTTPAQVMSAGDEYDELNNDDDNDDNSNVLGRVRF
jgi:protein involved in polysaccharide export with SLBB domain